MMSAWDADSCTTKGQVSAVSGIFPFARAFRLPLEIIGLLLNVHRRYFSPSVKRPGCEADRFPVAEGEVKDE